MSVRDRLQQRKLRAYAEIEEKFVCSHEQREIRLRKIGDGRLAFYRQCMRCGNAGNAISKKVAESAGSGKAVELFSEDLFVRWEAAKSEEYHRVIASLREEFRLMYEDYLLSPEWQARRSEVLNRASGLCEVCESSPATEVHHESYESVCNEPLDDLRAVCEFCHQVLHGKIDL